jgi:hypothetical protein
MDESSQAWFIKADCTPLPNRGGDEAWHTPTREVLIHWLAAFYPQGAGEKVSR